MNNLPPLAALSNTLGEWLEQAGHTIAVAESVTCGHLVAAIGARSGASQYLRGGITAYVLETKVALLGINREHAAQVNCVSPRVSRELAASVAQCMGADWGVATTGYAEPYPEAGFEHPGAFISIWRRTPGSTPGTPRSHAGDDRPLGREIYADRIHVSVPSEMDAAVARLECQQRITQATLHAVVDQLRSFGSH